MKHTVHQIKLSSGAEGLLINIPDALVMTFDFNFRAGEYLVDPNKWEVPHLMEHVLLGANELYPKARDFQAELDRNGGYSNATTSVYDITYEAECADFEWDRVLSLMLIAISKPLFLSSEFEAEYGNVEEEIVARSNNHYRKLSLKMRKDFGLLSKTDDERLKLMPNVELKDIVKHYKSTHTAPNLRFIIAGNINTERKKTIEMLINDIELEHEGTRIDLPDETPLNLDKPIYIDNETVENLYFYIDTFKKTRLTQQETDALSLTNTLLTETLYSRIFGTAREKGLVYGMSSGISYTRDVSNFWCGAQVSNKNAVALMKIIAKEISAVMDGKLTDYEIEAAKQYNIGRFQRSAQTVGGTAGGYASRYFFDDEVEDYYNFPNRVKAVTKQDMVDSLQSMFKDKIWGIGALGNCGNKLPLDLEKEIEPLWS